MIELYRHPDGHWIAHDSDALYIHSDAPEPGRPGARLRIPIGTVGLMNLAISMLQIVQVEIGGAAPSLNTGTSHADDDH